MVMINCQSVIVYSLWTISGFLKPWTCWFESKVPKFMSGGWTCYCNSPFKCIWREFFSLGKHSNRPNLVIGETLGSIISTKPAFPNNSNLIEFYPVPELLKKATMCYNLAHCSYQHVHCTHNIYCLNLILVDDCMH